MPLLQLGSGKPSQALDIKRWCVFEAAREDADEVARGSSEGVVVAGSAGAEAAGPARCRLDSRGSDACGSALSWPCRGRQQRRLAGVVAATPTGQRCRSVRPGYCSADPLPLLEGGPGRAPRPGTAPARGQRGPGSGSYRLGASPVVSLRPGTLLQRGDSDVVAHRPRRRPRIPGRARPVSAIRRGGAPWAWPTCAAWDQTPGNALYLSKILKFLGQ